MNILTTKLSGLLIIEPQVFGDGRGYFVETYSAERYAAAGLKVNFVQDNLSFSRQGVLRGLHFQNPGSQGKLITVLEGDVFDVAVDIRVGSPTFGKWECFELDGKSKRQIYVPEGFAHGFIVMSETALFSYKCTMPYNPKTEATIIWNDPDLLIPWPVRGDVVDAAGGEPIQLSDKDRKGLRLKDFQIKFPDRLPRFNPQSLG